MTDTGENQQPEQGNSDFCSIQLFLMCLYKIFYFHHEVFLFIISL